MKNKHLFTIISLLFSTLIFAQYTAVPDTVFEQYLIDEGIDTDGIINGQFLTANAIGVDFLDLDFLPVSDLTGIEAFVDLERLDARDTNFASADFSQNILLNQLTIVNSPLNSINLSQNINLLTLFADNCELSSIDVSNNINLNQLSIDNNYLTSIDVSNLQLMSSFSLEGNNFTSLDLPLLQSLGGLIINDNRINSLNLSNLPSLQTLEISNNNLTEIDLSNNPQFKHLLCINNVLTQLDFTQNPLIKTVYCSSNQITNVYFGSTNYLREFISVGNFFSSIDLSNMPELYRLYIGENINLTSIDVTQCPALRFIICSNNNIENSIDLTQNPLLEWFISFDNPIPSIDTSQNPLLNDFAISNLSITQMDLSNNPLLETVIVTNMPNIEWVDLRNGNNEIIDFYSLNSPNLTCVYVDDANSSDGSFVIDPQTTLVNNEEECDALGINDFELRVLFNVFPNPVNSGFNIENYSNHSIKTTKIYAVSGKLVLEKKDNPNKIDIGHLPTGLYLVKIQTDIGEIIKKVIKE